MSKQTAVEWLFNKMLTEKHTISEWNDIREQAKEIEKQMTIDAFKEGNLYHGWALKHEPEQYYNETYKKDK
jgi:hypothetical protein